MPARRPPPAPAPTLTADETERAHLPRDLAPVASFRVTVAEGPDAGATAVVGAEGGSFLVGTSPTCDLVLSDRRVSRRHLALDVQDGHLRLTDRGSTNGTKVGPLVVEVARLSGGERIHVGDSTLRLERVHSSGAATLWPVESFGRLLGGSAAMRRLYPRMQKLAAAHMPVLVEGETGTGKELFAEALHEMGPRKAHPFVVFDCATLDPRSAETVLFGEERRLPSGAVEVRKGAFEEAQGGTLLLDEIAELPLATQARLSRAVERREVCRVGGDRWIAVDARILATSRKNLDREVEHGRFRDDLFFRLAGARLELPPLREREGDVALLASAFWRRMMGETATVPDEILGSFEGYAWPGNVRELETLLARRAALGDLDEAPPEPSAAGSATASSDDARVFARVLALDLPFSEARARVISEFEAYFVQRVLARHGGNVSRAAAASGIARRYFQILKTRRAPSGSTS
jgi:DNA-binding NtrC family response regulator